MSEQDDFAPYLSGEKLYGDDFSPDELSQWFREEEDGYANLGAKQRNDYQYEYHQLNIHHFFRFLGGRRIESALGFGSAWGDEFLPVADRLEAVTILDASDAFSTTTQIGRASCRYVKPNVLGDLPFENEAFDLITCFGAMHHVPNVSHVMREMHRCLSPDGLLFVREPVVSMGDWRKPRRGLTRNERGIPVGIFEKIIVSSGFQVVRKKLCDFRPIIVLVEKLGGQAFNSRLAVRADSLFSNLLPWRPTYHRTAILDKLKPAMIAYILAR